MNELEALIYLTTIPHIGSIKARLLIQHYGSATAALQADPTSLLELPGFGPKIVQAWQNELKKGSGLRYLEEAQQAEIQILPYTDPNYPKRLLEIMDYPLILYVKGSLRKNDQRSLALIGTRQASIYGLEMARKISHELAEAGFTIVSGFARGIDTVAHQAALEKGRTIGVLGSGLGHIYPKENARLAEQVIQNGALMSELPFSTPPDRQFFPQRNRIVSGMTLGTVLIEAPHSSGALITAERARTQGRPVFALPGRADIENFRGNHQLIKSHRAELIENGQDVIINYSELFTSLPCPLPPSNQVALEKEEEHFIQTLPVDELSIEEIASRTQLPMAKVNVLLMSLVLKKIVKEYPGKIYKKVMRSPIKHG